MLKVSNLIVKILIFKVLLFFTSKSDEQMKLIKADQEKLKGNEAYNANSYDEAIAYYTRSIKLLPNAASYNNRAMTCKNLKSYTF